MSNIIIPSSVEEYKYLVGVDSSMYAIKESVDTINGVKRPMFTSISGRSNCQNGNGRVYSRSVLDSAFKEFFDRYVKTSTALGEIEHPTREKDVYKVPLELSAVKVVNLYKNDDDPDTWWGDYMPTSFAKGVFIIGALNDGIKFGVSTRGFGKYDNPQTKKNVTEYHIKAIDCVMDPSTPGAFAESIKESAEKIMESRSFILDRNTGEFIEAAYDNLKSAVRTGNNELMLSATQRFINSLKGTK